MPRERGIFCHSLSDALHRETRPGRSIPAVADETSVSRTALYRRVREEHHEPRLPASAKSPGGSTGCVVGRMGPETRKLVLRARRAERSVRVLAVAIGVSRSAMRWQIRD